MATDPTIWQVMTPDLGPHLRHTIAVAYTYSDSPMGARNGSNIDDLPVNLVLSVMRKRLQRLAVLRGKGCNYETVCLKEAIELVESRLAELEEFLMKEFVA
jgi:hypothetical protein